MQKKDFWLVNFAKKKKKMHFQCGFDQPQTQFHHEQLCWGYGYRVVGGVGLGIGYFAETR